MKGVRVMSSNTEKELLERIAIDLEKYRYGFIKHNDPEIVELRLHDPSLSGKYHPAVHWLATFIQAREATLKAEYEEKVREARIEGAEKVHRILRNSSDPRTDITKYIGSLKNE